ncbi:hypothetical protein TNCV_3484631 [Trichonephila clavipes]|nr:hypothetical protein TNCV_3484631 [Trichonephila clavipes]
MMYWDRCSLGALIIGTADTAVAMSLTNANGKGEGSTAIGKHFNLGESTVRAIKKNEAAIKNRLFLVKKLSTKFASYTRDVLLERTERAIAIWIEEQVQRRIPIWPACVTDNTTTETSTLSDEIINLAHETGGDGFNTFSHNDVDKLLVGDALSDNDIIDLTLDLTVDGVVGLEESSSQSLITDDIVRKGRATQNENEVCENPWPLPQISIAETVSSDDEGDLEPLRKRCKPL